MGKLWFRNVGWGNEPNAVSKDYVPCCILTALRSVEDQVLFHLRSSVPPSFPKNYSVIRANMFCETDAVFTAELLAFWDFLLALPSFQQVLLFYRITALHRTFASLECESILIGFCWCLLE